MKRRALAWVAVVLIVAALLSWWLWPLLYAVVMGWAGDRSGSYWP